MFTVKEFIEENKEEIDVKIYLEWAKEDVCDPLTEILWEGNLRDIPAKYWINGVCEVARSLNDAEKGIRGFVLRMKKEEEK